jgi:predicted Fe-Mo cluster-binding NifX family protein
MAAQRGAEAVLTGSVGPNAFDTLAGAGVAVYTNFTGTVREALERFRTETLEPVRKPSVRSKAGL